MVVEQTLELHLLKKGTQLPSPQIALQSAAVQSKGSKERHLKRDAGIADNGPHNQTNQMSLPLSFFKMLLVPKA